MPASKFGKLDRGRCRLSCLLNTGLHFHFISHSMHCRTPTADDLDDTMSASRTAVQLSVSRGPRDNGKNPDAPGGFRRLLTCCKFLYKMTSCDSDTQHRRRFQNPAPLFKRRFPVLETQKLVFGIGFGVYVVTVNVKKSLDFLLTVY